MKRKKGSITVIFIILLSISNLLVRINRLVISHTFLEKGIYSIDKRGFDYDILINEIENYLNERYETEESYNKFSEMARTFKFKDYNIKTDLTNIESYGKIIFNINKGSYTVEAWSHYDKELSRIVLKRIGL